MATVLAVCCPEKHNGKRQIDWIRIGATRLIMGTIIDAYLRKIQKERRKAMNTTFTKA
jgi:hypothetical protein